MESPIHTTLNKEQQEAVTHTTGPLLIIAGAGTGKTMVITERLHHLIASGLAQPSEIVALTFTQKAAQEMEERIDVRMPYGYSRLWISTFHAFCDEILRTECFHIGLTPTFRLLTEAESLLLLRRHLFLLPLDYFRPLGNPTKFLSAMLTHFARLRDEDITPEQYRTWVEKKKQQIKTEEELLIQKQFAELAQTYQMYTDLKMKHGYMDFGDLIANTLLLFRTRKHVLSSYQKRIKFILVDEFQDTNIAQNELLVLLAGENKNITAVADDDQSVYKFRGAAVSNVLSFRTHFPDAKLLVLTNNYRSTQKILDHAYRLIQHNNPDRLEVKEHIEKKLIAARKKIGSDPVFLLADRLSSEVEMVISHIRQLTKEQKYTYGDIAILARANSHMEPFIRALSRRGIPFQLTGPGQLFRQAEIKDLIAYLQLLTNIEDTVSFYRILAMEFFHLSSRDLLVIAAFAKKYAFSLFEACEVIVGMQIATNVHIPLIATQTKEMLSTLLTMIIRHAKLALQENAGQILYYFLSDSGMLQAMLENRPPFAGSQTSNIAAFFARLARFEEEHDDTSIPTVLEWILLSLEMGESPLASDSNGATIDAVRLLTVHGAKGLEFPVVFLVNLVAQRFPTIEKREPLPLPDELIKESLPSGNYHEQEERRLFYVGMTRARDRLFLSAAKQYGESARVRQLSPFIAETFGQERIVEQIQTSTQLSLLSWEKEEQKKAVTPSSTPFPSYLSYSQIDTFLLCPLHYKLRYILHIPSAPAPALSFGTSMHAVLKELYERRREGASIDKPLLTTLLAKHWKREGYKDKQYETVMKKRGERLLAAYIEKEFPSTTKVLALEQPFSFRIASTKGMITIGGRIDRIDEHADGTIEIIDYKTGKVPAEKKLAKDLQLSLYALAATQIKEFPFGRESAHILLTFYYLDSQKKISTTRTNVQLTEEKEKILSIAHDIHTSDFACSGNLLCTSCEYKLFCGIVRE